jgi:hypothetical protein
MNRQKIQNLHRFGSVNECERGGTEMRVALVAAMILAGVSAGSSARGAAPEARTAWLHVRVEEPGKNGKVHVNLPLAVVEAALKAAPETLASHGKINFGHGRHGRHGRHQISISELRQMWQELRNAGDMEMVTVEEDDGHVTVARRGNTVEIRVKETRRNETVHVDVPVAMVDALLASPGDELNMRAGLDELRKMRGDIVRVKDRQTSVRVWIDEQAPQGGN